MNASINCKGRYSLSKKVYSLNCAKLSYKNLKTEMQFWPQICSQKKVILEEKYYNDINISFYNFKACNKYWIL